MWSILLNFLQYNFPVFLGVKQNLTVLHGILLKTSPRYLNLATTAICIQYFLFHFVLFSQNGFIIKKPFIK